MYQQRGISGVREVGIPGGCTGVGIPGWVIGGLYRVPSHTAKGAALTAKRAP